MFEKVKEVVEFCLKFPIRVWVLKLQEVIDFLLHRFGDRASINLTLGSCMGKMNHFINLLNLTSSFSKSTNEVSEIVVICAKQKVPIVPFGAGIARGTHRSY